MNDIRCRWVFTKQTMMNMIRALENIKIVVDKLYVSFSIQEDIENWVYTDIPTDENGKLEFIKVWGIDVVMLPFIPSNKAYLTGAHNSWVEIDLETEEITNHTLLEEKK